MHCVCLIYTCFTFFFFLFFHWLSIKCYVFIYLYISFFRSNLTKLYMENAKSFQSFVFSISCQFLSVCLFGFLLIVFSPLSLCYIIQVKLVSRYASFPQTSNFTQPVRASFSPAVDHCFYYSGGVKSKNHFERQPSSRDFKVFPK